MSDIATQLEIRRLISLCEGDMRRATERASEAARQVSRAIVLFTTPMDIDLDVVNAALSDLREARQAFAAALKRKQELKAELGED
jgi:hypothetical protein